MAIFSTFISTTTKQTSFTLYVSGVSPRKQSYSLRMFIGHFISWKYIHSLVKMAKAFSFKKVPVLQCVFANLEHRSKARMKTETVSTTVSRLQKTHHFYYGRKKKTPLDNETSVHQLMVNYKLRLKVHTPNLSYTFCYQKCTPS